MCVCTSETGCHRQVVLNALRDEGYTVTPFVPAAIQAAARQPTMF
jgi:hypothetical protein